MATGESTRLYRNVVPARGASVLTALNVHFNLKFGDLRNTRTREVKPDQPEQEQL